MRSCHTDAFGQCLRQPFRVRPGLDCVKDEQKHEDRKRGEEYSEAVCVEDLQDPDSQPGAQQYEDNLDRQ